MVFNRSRIVVPALILGLVRYILLEERCLLSTLSSNKSDLRYSASRLSSACLSRLEALEASFNERRNARRAYTSFTKFDQDKTLLDLYEPESVCIYEERFGQGAQLDRYQSFGDGPKFICGTDLIAAKSNKTGSSRCLVYSVGSNNQIDFETSVYKHLNCETHTFDPTLDKPFVGDEYAIFHDWGLGKDGDAKKIKQKTFTAKSLETIVKDLGHEGRTIDILKIDCEGCEWTVMPKVCIFILFNLPFMLVLKMTSTHWFSFTHGRYLILWQPVICLSIKFRLRSTHG